MSGGHHNTRNCIKGLQNRKVENHCFRVGNELQLLEGFLISQVLSSKLNYLGGKRGSETKHLSFPLRSQLGP